LNLRGFKPRTPRTRRFQNPLPNGTILHFTS
jgi:hypothetical protein